MADEPYKPMVLAAVDLPSLDLDDESVDPADLRRVSVEHEGTGVRIVLADGPDREPGREANLLVEHTHGVWRVIIHPDDNDAIACLVVALDSAALVDGEERELIRVERD